MSRNSAVLEKAAPNLDLFPSARAVVGTPQARPANHLELIRGVFLSGPQARVVSLVPMGGAAVAPSLASQLAAVSGGRVVILRFAALDPARRISPASIPAACAPAPAQGVWTWPDTASDPGTLALFRSGPEAGALSGPALRKEAVRVLRETFDFVLLDCPDLSLGPEAAMTAALADGVLLVLESGRTRKDGIVAARRTLDAAGARLLGSVLY